MYMVHTLVAIALKSCIDRDDILMDVTSNVSNFPQLIDPTFIGYGLYTSPLFPVSLPFESCKALETKISWVCADKYGPYYNVVRAACPAMCRLCGDNIIINPDEPRCEDYGIVNDEDALRATWGGGVFNCDWWSRTTSAASMCRGFQTPYSESLGVASCPVSCRFCTPRNLTYPTVIDGLRRLKASSPSRETIHEIFKTDLLAPPGVAADENGRQLSGLGLNAFTPFPADMHSLHPDRASFRNRASNGACDVCICFKYSVGCGTTSPMFAPVNSFYPGTMTALSMANYPGVALNDGEVRNLYPAGVRGISMSMNLAMTIITQKMINGLPEDLIHFESYYLPRLAHLGGESEGDKAAFSFSRFKQLEKLQIWRSVLTAWRTHWLAGLSKLIVISLRQNMLTSIPPGSFADQVNLRMLSVAQNQLSVIPRALCCMQMPTLMALHMYSNKLTSIDPMIFGGRGQVMESLIYLNFRDNAITEVPAGTFQNLPRLGFLYMADNDIDHIGIDAFPQITPFIEVLDSTENSNPSICHLNINMETGRFDSGLSCDCAPGYVHPVDGSTVAVDACVPVVCPRTIPYLGPGVVELTAAEAQGAADIAGPPSHEVGSQRLVGCGPEYEGSTQLYTCATSGVWVVDSNVTCQEISRSPYRRITRRILGEPFVLRVPDNTERVEFDPDAAWDRGRLEFLSRCVVKPTQKMLETVTVHDGRVSVRTELELAFFKSPSFDDEALRCAMLFGEGVEGSAFAVTSSKGIVTVAVMRAHLDTGSYLDFTIELLHTRFRTVDELNGTPLLPPDDVVLHHTTGTLFELNLTRPSFLPLFGDAEADIGFQFCENARDAPLPGITIELRETPAALPTPMLTGTPAASTGAPQNVTICIEAFDTRYATSGTSVLVTEFVLILYPALVNAGLTVLGTVDNVPNFPSPVIRGGRLPLTYEQDSSAGGLPTGIGLDSATGTVYGTSNTTGTWLVVSNVRDANGATLSLRTLALTLRSAPRVIWVGVSFPGLPPATRGVPYTLLEPKVAIFDEDSPSQQSKTIQSADLYTLKAGVLPPGVVLTKAGLIGTPKKSGIFSFVIRVHVHSLGIAGELNAGEPVTLRVLDCGVDGSAGVCGKYGVCDDAEPFDSVAVCACDESYEQDRDTGACVASSIDRSSSADIIGGTVGIAFLVLLIALSVAWFRKTHAASAERAQIESAAQGNFSDVSAVDSHTCSSFIEKHFSHTKACDIQTLMFRALDLKMDSEVAGLVDHGADPTIRHPDKLTLAQAILLSRDAPNESTFASVWAAGELLFDEQFGALLTDSSKLALVGSVLTLLSLKSWRAADGSTTLHRVVHAREHGFISTVAAVALASQILEAQSNLLTTKDSRGQTPGDVAMKCEDSRALEQLLSVVVYGSYQLPEPDETMYRSATSVVMRCRDLSAETSQSDRGFTVLKMISSRDSFLREISSRKTLASVSDSIVPVLSATTLDAAAVLTIGAFTVRSAASELNAGRRCGHAMEKQLMDEYPYAVCMPLADRSLSEILQSEQLAQNPLENLRFPLRALCTCIKAFHDNGVVHGDIKPKNVARQCGSLKLIDFDMSFTTPYELSVELNRSSLDESWDFDIDTAPGSEYDRGVQILRIGPGAFSRHSDGDNRSDPNAATLCNVVKLLEDNGKALIVGVNGADALEWSPASMSEVFSELSSVNVRLLVSHGSSGMMATSHAAVDKVHCTSAYTSPELFRWALDAAEPEVDMLGAPAASECDLIHELGSPFGIDIWAFGVTMYELVTGVALFQNSYDKATSSAADMLANWAGLSKSQIEQVTHRRGCEEEVDILLDLLYWCLEPDAAARPSSMDAILQHAFFDKKSGTMREHFVIDRIRTSLNAGLDNSPRPYCKVFISYSWANTTFVLDRLAFSLAPVVEKMWLDRLGGEDGMGEWCKDSMRKGVAGCDVVIACISPAYIKSKNCGLEMDLCRELGKPVIPIKLGVPFTEWPPKEIGGIQLTNQLEDAASGDMVLFVDMEEPELFQVKLNRELLPRLVVEGARSREGSAGVLSHGASAVRPRKSSGWLKVRQLMTITAGWTTMQRLRSRKDVHRSSMRRSMRRSKNRTTADLVADSQQGSFAGPRDINEPHKTPRAARELIEQERLQQLHRREVEALREEIDRLNSVSRQKPSQPKVSPRVKRVRGGLPELQGSAFV